MTQDVACPECGSRELLYNDKKRQYRCKNCDKPFAADRPFESKRVFLSYGHDEFAPIAERIRTDLVKRGHQVWIDSERLREGADWERAIESGLEWVGADGNNGRVLFLITPHSARRPDGYCLNELAKALLKRIEIIPVMLVYVEPPLSICRIQWLDMQDCVPLEERLSRYEAKFQRLVTALEEGKIDSEGVQARLLQVLDPLNFAADLEKHNARFTGREWVFRQVDTWLADPKGSRVFWVVGGPGVGKSAIACRLATTRGDVAAFHQCVYRHEQKANPIKVVTSLAYQLSTQLPEYQERLSRLNLEKLVRESLDGRTLFDNLVVQPLAANFPRPDRTILAVIDGLDEASTAGDNELARFISSEIPKTPDWLRLIVTSRPEPEILFHLQGLTPYRLDAASPENHRDIELYLRRELQSYVTPDINLETVIGTIMDRGEGLFLYIEHICEEVRQGRLDLRDAEDFPKGLGGIYAEFFKRRFPDASAYASKIRPALRAVLAAYEPLSTEILASLLRWGKEEVNDFLCALGALFPATDGKIAPFHRSVTEWLGDQSKAQFYFADVQEGQCMLAEHGFFLYLKGMENLPAYYKSFLPTHLSQVGRYEDFVRLLSDPAYLLYAWKEDKTRVVSWWADAEKGGKASLESIFAPVVENPSSHGDFIPCLAELLELSCRPAPAAALRRYLVGRCRAEGGGNLAEELVSLGKVERTLGNLDAALASYNEAESAARTQGDIETQAEATYEKAELHKSRGEYGEAERFFVENLALLQQSGRWDQLAQSVRKILLVYTTEGKYEDACRLGERILSEAGASLSLDSRLILYLAVAYSLRSLREYELAEKYLDDGLGMVAAVRDLDARRDTKALKGDLLIAKSAVEMNRDGFESAMKLRLEALSIFESIHDYQKLASTAGTLGDLHYQQGKTDDAALWYERKRGYAERTGNRALIASAMHSVAFSCQVKYEYQAALGLYEQSLEMKKGIGIEYGVTLGNIGDINRFMGRFAKAEAVYREMLEKAERGNDFGRAGRCLRLIAQAQYDLGLLNEAEGTIGRYERFTEESHAAFKKLPSGRRYLLLVKAAVLAARGETDSAAEIARSLMRNAPEIETSIQADTIGNVVAVGRALLACGDLEGAEQALSSFKDRWTGDNKLISIWARYSSVLAELRLQRGDIDGAVVAADEALSIYSSTPIYGAPAALLVKVRIALSRGDAAEAREKLEKARAGFQEAGQRHFLAECSVLEGQIVCQESGDVSAAERLVREGRDILATMGWARKAGQADEVLRSLRYE